MLSAFSSILLTHIVTLIITESSGATPGGDVTVTVLLKAKDSKEQSYELQVSGPFAEVDAGLVAEITKATKLVAEFKSTVADLDAKIAETKKEKEALLKAEQDAAKKAKKSGDKKPEAKDADNDDNDNDEPKPEAAAAAPVVRRTLARPKPAATTPPASGSADPVAAGLTPAVPLTPVAEPPVQPTQTTIADLGL